MWENLKYFIVIPGKKKLSMWKKCFWLITIPRVLLGLPISFFVLLLLTQCFWQFYSLLHMDHQFLKRLNLLFPLMECKPEEGYNMDWPKCYSNNKNNTKYKFDNLNNSWNCSKWLKPKSNYIYFLNI